MTANVGTLDRTLRLIVGLLLIALAVFGVIGAWGYIGIVPLLTGLFRFFGVRIKPQRLPGVVGRRHDRHNIAGFQPSRHARGQAGQRY